MPAGRPSDLIAAKVPWAEWSEEQKNLWRREKLMEAAEAYRQKTLAEIAARREAILRDCDACGTA